MKKRVKLTTLICAGAVIGGDLCAPGSARIDGEVKGSVTVDDVLVLGNAGIVHGNINAQSVQIGGEVYGNIHAPERAELTATAKVIGDLHTASFVVDEQAVFQGKCNMGQEALEVLKEEHTEDTSESSSEDEPTQDVSEGKTSTKTKKKKGKKSAAAIFAQALKEVKEEQELEDEESDNEAASANADATANAENESGDEGNETAAEEDNK